MGLIPVYCLAGLKAFGVGKMQNNHLGGQLFTDPYTRRDILYPNDAATFAHGTTGAEMAYDAARKTKGPCILLGHSMGAEALQILLRSNPDLDHDDVVVVLTGNPERKYNGISTLNVVGFNQETYGGTGFPAGTPFKVFDLCRQYEYFADYPNQTSNLRAVRNAFSGISLHLDYSNVRLGDPANVTKVEGRVTYSMQPTFVMPSCRKTFWTPDRQAVEDAKARPVVEKAYTRPFKVPTQTVMRTSSTGGYDSAARRAVRLPKTPPWNPFRRAA